MSPQQQQLIRSAIASIANGDAGRGQQNSASAEAQLRRAQELHAELSSGGRQRPGLLTEAETVAQNYLRLVGRLAPNESLRDNLTVRIHGTDGRPREVIVPRWETVQYLQNQMGQVGGLILGGRPLAGETLVYDLWLRDQLGSLTVANNQQPRIQATVRNTAG